MVKPSYRFWAPWVGTHSRASNKLINTEYKKCQHDKDVAESGTRHQMNVEDVIEVFEQGSVSWKIITFVTIVIQQVFFVYAVILTPFSYLNNSREKLSQGK